MQYEKILNNSRTVYISDCYLSVFACLMYLVHGKKDFIYEPPTLIQTDIVINLLMRKYDNKQYNRVPKNASV